MLYSYEVVNRFYKMGLFTKEDVQLFVEVKYFAKEDYDKMSLKASKVGDHK